MKKIQPKVGIIGGGLAGVYTAYLLTQHNITFQIIEAKSILGGRICGEDTHSSDYRLPCIFIDTTRHKLPAKHHIFRPWFGNFHPEMGSRGW